jgi:hypothetical protein
VEIDSDRRFRFPVDATAFWDAVASTDDYRQWWPWLRSFDARGLIAGDEWRCAVRAPLGYTVRFTVHLDEVRTPTLVRATIGGDIVGRAELGVTPDRECCDVRLTSSLKPRNRGFAVLAFLAAPLARHGHDWILDTGAGQFAGRALDREV